MLHVPILPAPTVKLDIQRLLQSSPSPPSLPTQSQPPSHSGTTHYPSFTPVSSSPAVSVSTQPLSAAARPQPSHQQALAPNYAPLHHRSHGAYSSSNPPSGNHPVPSQRDTSPDSGLSAASAAGSTISPGSSIIAPAKRPAPDEQHPSATPAKKQSKWTTAENATIISLRGQGMKWEDVSKRVPGRSPTSCRLHYQNYLERRTPWDDEKKNKLARLYERCVKFFSFGSLYAVTQQLAVPFLQPRNVRPLDRYCIFSERIARKLPIATPGLSKARIEEP